MRGYLLDTNVVSEVTSQGVWSQCRISRGKNVDISALDQALVRRDKGQIECLCSGGDETVRGVAMRKIDGRAHQHHIHREGNF